MSTTTFSGPVVSTNGFTGAVTGNITGNITGNVTGNVTGNLTGNVTGNLTGNVTGNVTGNISGATSAMTGASTALSYNPGTSAVAWTKVYKGTVSVNPAEIAAQTQAETEITIAGAATGDIVIMNPPASLEAGLIFSHARVSAANTVQVGLANITGTPVDGADLTWTYCILRFA